MKSSWAPRASAISGLLLLVGSGCVKDFDALSADFGSGGSAGSKGHAGSSGASHVGGGSSGSGGESSGEAGVGGESGEAGEAETGGRDGSGGSGSGGKGTGGASCVGGSATTCTGVSGCVDLNVGTPDGNGVDNCGACGTSCALANASSAKCMTAACALTCNSGFGDCNASTANDGCESDLTTIARCGSCQNACSSNGTASTQCTSGACVPTCGPSYGDCNGGAQPAPNDGCEAFFDALDHCTSGCDSAFVACDATNVCNGASCVAPNGLAVLSTPLTSSADATRFSDILPGFPLNLEGSSVRVRVYAPGATGGTLAAFVSDTASSFGSMVITDLANLSQKWTDIVVPIAGVNATIVKQVNLLVTGGSGPTLTPTVVYVDSVRTSNQLVNETFDTSYSGFTKSGLVFVTGAAVSWSASLP